MRQREPKHRGLFDIEHPSTWRRLRDGTVDTNGETDLFAMRDWDFYVDDAVLP